MTAGLAAFGLSRLLGRWPHFVERVLMDEWARSVIPPLSRLTGQVPVPVAELLIALYVLLRVVVAGRAGLAMARGRRRPTPTLLSGLGVLLRDGGILLLTFYLLWGFAYARAPAAERFGLPALGSVQDSVLVRLSDQMVRQANASYIALHHTDDAGTPTTMPDDWGVLDRRLQLGWSRAAARLPVAATVLASYGRPKALLSSSLVAYLGITGFYFPFTAEPLVVGTTPAVVLALTLAHEEAHQRGITNEGEATFLGFIVAMGSDDPLFRYSAAIRAQSGLLAALVHRDAEAARRLRRQRIPGVRRDFADLRSFTRRHQGSASRVATQVNDAYLKANRVPGGVESYDQVTRLLLRYARSRGGALPAN